MEIDSIPIKSNWLSQLLTTASGASPFSVLGSEYVGPNWNNFRDSIPTLMKRHINGNAMYVVHVACVRAWWWFIRSAD
jgi:hypothetical protein